MIFSATAACGALLASFHKIAAHASGVATVYTECSNINTLSPTPIPKAPPDPPSPITVQIIGTSKQNICLKL